MTEDAEKEVSKDVKKKGEGAGVALRTSAVMPMKLSRSGEGREMSEDDLKEATEKMQKPTDKMVEKADKAVEEKTKEIMII